MSEEEFIAQLLASLEKHSDTARETILRLLASLPQKVARLDLEVFPSQDGDGFFTIRASVDGPDLYVINKAIKANADLFGPRYTENGIEPPIPIVNPFEVEFPVNDVIVDCAAKWLQGIWDSLDPPTCPIPVQIIGHDDYGTVTPVDLHSGASN
jgi:hypothetical protein